MPRGHVSWFNALRGEGFLRGENGKEYYITSGLIAASGVVELQKGDAVDFDPDDDSRVAREVRPAGKKRFSLAANPFNHQDPTGNPKYFSGREAEIENALYALYNSKNLLIFGERGVGKSSLALQLAQAAEGRIEALQSLAPELISESGESSHFDHLVALHTCLPESSLNRVVAGLADALFFPATAPGFATKRTAEFGVDARLFKATIKEETEQRAPGDLAQFMVRIVGRAFEYFDEFRGIVFIVDEANYIDVDQPVAAFFRAASQGLRAAGFADISFVVSGLTSFSNRVRREDESVTRFFEEVPLLPMEVDDLTGIIDRALLGTPKTITSEASRRIVDRALKLPHPVHLLGHHAFRLDRDDVIDLDDVQKAEGWVVQKLKSHEFEDRLDKLALLDRYIIDMLASHPVGVMSLDELVQGTGAKHDEVSGKIGELNRRGWVRKVKSKDSSFELRDGLFKLYFNWIKGLHPELGRRPR